MYDVKFNVHYRIETWNPDLTLKQMYFSPLGSNQSDATWLGLCVQSANEGSTPSSAYNVAVYVDDIWGSPSQIVSRPSLEAGGSNAVCFNLPGIDQGVHYVRARIYAPGGAEQNTGNNEIVRSVQDGQVLTGLVAIPKR